MAVSTQLYNQLLTHLRQYAHYCDLRHLKALAWMVNATIQSGTLSLPTWEPYVNARAQMAQSFERRWQRFMDNLRIDVFAIYTPLVMVALEQWRGHRIFIAMDTTMIGDKYCMIHLSIVCCGRAIPLLWKTLEHESASVAFAEYRPLLHHAQLLLKHHRDVTLLADRGFANQALVDWLEGSGWHYRIRIPSDTLVQVSRNPAVEVATLWPAEGEATLYEQVRLWKEGTYSCNLVLANLAGAEEPWAVITDESPSLQTLWDYGSRFCVEELFLDSKSGVFEFEDSKIDSPEGLTRLYLVAAVALLYSTLQGMAVQLAGLRRQVDPHWRRGLSYLKIGLRWLKGVVNKGRQLFAITPLFFLDPDPCFASKRAQKEYYEQRRFLRVHLVRCNC